MIRLAAILCIAIAMLAGARSGTAAVYTVTKTADTNDGACDADCSLREAVTAANGTADNDTIVFALPLFSQPQTITLSGTDIIMNNNGTLAILGTGANRLTISGNNASRVLTANVGLVGSLSHVRLTGGTGVSSVTTGRGGAFYNNGGNFTLSNVVITGNSAANGGGLNNAGTATLTILNSVISGNTATGAGGGMQNFSGNTMNIINTTVSGNTCNSTLTGGGAIQANGTLNVTNSTFSGNNATGGDGGAFFYNGQGLTMTNTTIVGNTATGGGSGGLHKSTTTMNANIRNTIIAGNTGGASPDATGAMTSQGNNIIQNVGTSTGWVMSDQQSVDPLLAAFGFYGGLGMTYLPLAASPAINAGQNCVLDLTCGAANPSTPVTTDQRGAPRPFGPGVDVGAVESSLSYVATLPSATAGVVYNLSLVPANGPFTYLLNAGSLGGLELNSSTSTTITGTSTTPGVFNATVQVTGAPGQTFQNYRITILGSNTVSLTGQVRTSSGEGVGMAVVTLTGLNGPSYSTITNGFGYFRIDGITAGLSGSLTVSGKKGLTFNPVVVTVADVTDGLTITAQP